MSENKSNKALKPKISISIFVSILLLLTCFYRYNVTIERDYIKKTEKSIFKEIDGKIITLKNKIETTKNNLIIIAENKVVNREIIDEKEKQYFYESNEEDNSLSILTLKEFYETIEYNPKYMTELHESSTTIYSVSREKNKFNNIEVFVPIKVNDNITGVISKKINSEDLKEGNDIFEEQDLKSYIFRKDGELVFKEKNIEQDNIFEYLKNYKIDTYTLENLKNKIQNNEQFNIKIKGGNKKLYAFLKPVEKDLYVMQTIDEKFIKKNINEVYRLLFVILIQTITIAIVQILYIIWVIGEQNSKLVRNEKQKIQEIDLLINSIHGGVIKISSGDILKINFSNDGFYNLTGYSKEEYLEKFDDKFIDIVDEKYKNKILELFKNNTNTINIEIEINKKHGEKIWISLTGGYLERIGTENIWQCIIMDVEEYKQVLNNLIMEKERYSIISNMSEDIIFEYNIKTGFIKIPEKYKNIFKNQVGIDLEKDILIKTLFKKRVIHKKDKKEFIATMKSVLENSDNFSGELRIKNVQGGYNWFFYQGVVLKGSNGEIYKIIGKISNVDKYKKEIETLQDKVSRDALTKVFNKIAIENIVNKTLKENKNKEYVLFIIDIDNFKDVNDTFGHIFGDIVLKEITSHIMKVFNKDEIIARIGGDEFVVFLENKNYEYIKEKAEFLCSTFRKTYVKKDKDYRISASVGIARYPNHARTYTELLEKADIAGYSAKNQGKDRYEIYNEDMKNISNMKKLNIEETKELSDNIIKISYENILIEVFEAFLEAKDMTATINLILSMICKMYNMDRACIFAKSEENNDFYKKYEYEDEILVATNPVERVKFNEEEFLEIYNNQSFLYVENFEKLEYKENIEKYIQSSKAIKSLFVCYLMEKEEIKAYISIESYNENIKLKEEDKETIFLISRIISCQLSKYNAELRLETENQINKAIVENQQLNTYVVRKDSYEMLYYNDRFKNLLPHAQVGAKCYELKGQAEPCRDCPITNEFGIYSSNTSKYFCEMLNKWMATTSTGIKWIDQTDAYMICCKDLTEYLEQLNYIDSLTGLPSIDKFKIQASKLLKEQEFKYALLYMDVDKFKNINDNFGFSTGDEVLKQMGIVLNDITGRNEIFCRINEDKFAIMIKYKNEEDLKLRIEIINEKILKMQKEFFEKINIIIICGIYKIEKITEDINAMLDKSNFVRKSIKGACKNSYEIYNKEIEIILEKEKSIEQNMVQALKNKEFVVYLQPKFNLSSKKICGAEALTRWKLPNGTMMQPNDFIPIFEKNEFIANLDFYVYEEVFKTMKRWIEEGRDIKPISLNISRVQVKNEDFVDKVSELINKYQIPVEFLEFEITENIFIGDGQRLKALIKNLKETGVKVSIDDFGAAYSSLNLLKDLNVDIVKLDKGFLDGIKIDSKEQTVKKDKIIMGAIVKMTKELGLGLICEGIETDLQIEFLKEVGYEIGQGYIFDRPLPIEKFEKKFLNNNI